MGDKPASRAVDLMERLISTAHRLASASGPEDVFQAALDMVLDCTVRLPEQHVYDYVDHIAILQLDAESRQPPAVVSAWDRKPGAMPLYGSTFPGAALEALARGKPLIVDDVAASNGSAILGEAQCAKLSLAKLHSCLFVPLITDERMHGVLIVGSQQHQFSESDLARFQNLASQVANIVADEALLHTARTVQPDLLTETESYFRSAVQNAADPIITTDRAGVITSVNSAAEALYGYDGPKIVGQPVTILAPSSRRVEVESWLRTVVQEQRAVQAETEAVDNRGQVVQIYTTLSPIKSVRGDVVGVAVFSTNIGERVAYRNTLQEERDLLEAILETTNDALVLVDPQREIVAANLQFEVFFNLPRYQLINRPVGTLIEQVRARPDLPGDLANIFLTFTGDHAQSAAGDFEVSEQTPRTLIWYSSPVFAHDGADVGRLFVFRDATRERESDRMKTEFVSLVSHELRTPMTSISGFTDLLLEGDAGPLDGRAREYLEIIKLNADRLIALINDVLDITRIEAGHVELRRDQCPLGSIIDSIVQTMYPLFEMRRQTLVVRVAQDLPELWIDRERITQVITNLLANATKYTPGGGQITIEARKVSSADALTSGAPDNIVLPVVQVSIDDTGIGIAPKDQGLLFTRFYRTEQATRRQISGTGLGLTIVKSFVELHGGHVWFHSEIDQGSSFSFTIPLLEGT